MAGLVKAIYNNKTNVPADPELDFTGQTVLVTGSNTGLGLEAAAKLAKSNVAHLILAVRSLEKGASAQRVVQHLASDRECRVEVWQLDMSSYDSIAAFAKRVTNELPRLDIALLNAGVFMNNFEKSKYGWEQTLQVNALGTMLLGLLLLPKLKASKTEDRTPVLEFVSSGRIYAVELTPQQKSKDTNTLESFNGPAGFSGGVLYRTSKLFIQCAARQMARMARPNEKEDPQVLVFTVCPGACQSELSRGVNGMLISVAKQVANLVFLRTTEEGSRTLVSGLGNGVKGHGEFWQSDVFKETPPLLEGEEGTILQEKLWNEMLDALEKDVPDVRQRTSLA